MVVFFIIDEGASILTSVHQLRTSEMYFPDETFLPKSNLPYVEARVNSKAAQLTEDGAQVICLFARFGVGASFLGIKTPFDHSVFSAAAAAFLLAFREPADSRWTSF